MSDVEMTPSEEKPRASRPLHISLSDSEDDISLDTSGDRFLDGLNISNKLKNLLHFKDFQAMDNDDDDDNDNDTLFTTPSILKTPGALDALLPSKQPSTMQERLLSLGKAKSRLKKKKALKKTSKKASSSSRKLSDDTPLQASSPKQDRFAELLRKAMDSASDSSDSENDRKLYQRTPTTNNVRPKQIVRKKKQVPSKAPPQEHQALGSMLLDSDSESEDDKATRQKRLSKKAEMEMYQETNRLQRNKEVKIQPRMKKRSLADLLKRIEDNNRPGQNTDHMQGIIRQMVSTSTSTSSELHTQSKVKEPDTLRATAASILSSAIDSDIDSDLEIIGGPPRKPELPSPDRAQGPIATFLSPPRPTGMSRNDLNKRLLDHIARDMLDRRRKLEKEAKAHGRFSTAEDRARKLLAREKEAELIDLEVQRRLLGNNRRQEDDSDSIPDEDEDEASVMELSGDEQSAEKADDTKEDQDVEEDEEDKVAPSTRRRRHQLSDASNKESRQPEPTNSILRFFQNQKTDEVPVPLTDESSDNNKTWRRLVSNTVETEIDNEQKSDGDLGSIPPPGEESLSPEQKEKDPLVGEERSEEEEDDEEDEEDREEDEEDEPKMKQQPTRPIKNHYVEEEAEEEEDEYFGMGGEDGEDEDLDEYEQDGVVVERNEETDHVDEATLREALNRQLAESDSNMVQRLLKDITSGGLRRRRAAMASGFMLDDFDMYDDDEDDNLVAIRRAAAAKRRKILEESGDVLQRLAQDPATAAFARAAQPMLEDADEDQLDASDEDEETAFASLMEESSQASIEWRVASSQEGLPRNTQHEPAEDVNEAALTVGVHIQSKSVSTVTELPKRQPHGLRAPFRSPTRVERFKNLLTEARGALGGSNPTAPRVGFGSGQTKTSQQDPVSSLERVIESAKISEPKQDSKLRRMLLSRTGSFS